MHTFKLEQFEGPLDLLLQLIEQEQLDITTVSLARVADQYLRYIDQIEEIVPDEVADFLVIASKLIYLKSKYLLPELKLEGEEEIGDLEKQLKIYQQYYDASKEIEKLISRGKFTYVRTHPLHIKQTEVSFSPPPNLQLQDLPQIFSDILRRIKEIRILPKIMMAKAVSIKERIEHLRTRLASEAKVVFSSIYNKQNKVDTIVSFLALLELIKQRFVVVDQRGTFAEINISRNGQTVE